jgi:hypothetical protein
MLEMVDLCFEWGETAGREGEGVSGMFESTGRIGEMSEFGTYRGRRSRM